MLNPSDIHPSAEVLKMHTRHHMYALHTDNVNHSNDVKCYDISINLLATRASTITTLFSNQILLQLSGIYPTFHRHPPAYTLPTENSCSCHIVLVF